MTPAALPDIDALPAGLEMDALIAERVMGWKSYKKGDVLHLGIPPYSTDDAAALEVWKIISTRGARPMDAITRFRDGPYRVGGLSRLEFWEEATAPTLALAICRAALRSMR